MPQSGRHRYWWGVGVLMLACLLVWPIIVHPKSRAGEADPDLKLPVAQMHDQIWYHERTIRQFVAQWPTIDFVNYPSATTPGYHLVMAMASLLNDSRLFLQLVSSCFGLLLVGVVWWFASRWTDPGVATIVTVPLATSVYVVSGSIWLNTDNLALLLAFAAVGVAAFLTPSRLVVAAAALCAAGAVFTRQIHLWAIAPAALTAITATFGAPKPLRRLVGGHARTFSASSCGMLIPLLILPFVIVVAFCVMWGGLTPPMPSAVRLHAAGLNPAALPYTLALAGGFGAFFGPLIAGSWRTFVRIDRTDVIAGVVGFIAGFVVPTDWDARAGRANGLLWGVVNKLDVFSVWERSAVIAVLAGTGTVILTRAWRAAATADRAREATVLMLTMVGWMLAQAMNPQLWQRYFEPPMLVLLAWLVAMGAMRGRGLRLCWPLIVLAFGFIALNIARNYWPLVAWDPAG